MSVLFWSGLLHESTFWGKSAKSFLPHRYRFSFLNVLLSTLNVTHVYNINSLVKRLFHLLSLSLLLFSPQKFVSTQGMNKSCSKVCVIIYHQYQRCRHRHRRLCRWCRSQDLLSFASVDSFIQSDFHENAHTIQNRFNETARTWNRIMRMWNVLNLE